MTKQREAIYNIIQSAAGHLTADEIYQQAKKMIPSIAMGTVYRNLGLMTKAGEIRRLTVPDAPDRYDRTPIPHGHLICQRCGYIEDVSIPQLLTALQQQTGQKVTSYELTAYYICADCQHKMVRNNKQ